MSRVIPTDRPLSDEDRAYLEKTSQEWKIAQIDAAFPPGASTPADSGTDDSDDSDDDDVVEVDEDISNFVEGLPNADTVKDQLEKRGLEGSGSRGELNAALAIGLQQKRDAGEEVVLEVL